VPLVQSAHWRSLDGVPGTLTYVPAAQELQAVQLGAFDVVLNEPLAQDAH
jgi:hypothetical protein